MLFSKREKSDIYGIPINKYERERYDITNDKAEEEETNHIERGS